MNWKASTNRAVRTVTFISLFTAATIGSARADRHKFQVNDPAIAKQILAKGGHLVADYGSYQIYETTQALPELDGKRGVENRDAFNHIELNSGDIDTSQSQVSALRKPVGSFAGKQMHLVQFAGPIQPAWFEALQKTGVKIVDFVPNDAYIVYGDAAAMAQLQSWAAASSFVQWDGAYEANHKIHPRARRLDINGNPRDIGTDYFTIQLQEDADANPATLALIDQLKLEPINRESRVLHFHNLTVKLDPASVDTIAAQPDVVSIHPYFMPRKWDERQDQIIAGNISGNSPTGPGYLAWLASKGFTQAQFTTSGFAVDLSDSGIDNGTTSPGHFGLYTSGNTNSGSRVIYNRLVGTPNAGSTLQGLDGHGNINSHIICAYNSLSGFPHADSAGYLYDLGVCPFVKIGSSVIFDSGTFTSPNYANLQSQAYHDGARVSNNSWGGTANTYTTDSQSYDALVRDAQPTGSTFPVTGNQEMVIVFAAGNAGPSAGTIGEPGTAKNVIAVGAAENIRSMSTANGGNNTSGNDGCTTPDTDADSANDVVGFSSRGPCSDGRIKPDICAPGTHITGGAPQTSPPPANTGTGTALAGFTGEGVCALPGGGSSGSASNFFPVGQRFYTESSGTSHSTPCVVGACALLRQYFINNFTNPPSPAMTKAYLINSARYMNGVSAGDTLPSNNQGLGELNLGTAFDGVIRFLRDEIPSDLFTNSGATRVFTGMVADPSKPLRVTLAWTDAPGATSGNAYKNNLDLTVSVGTNIYLGNVFSGQFSVTGGSADLKNNTENVFLPAGTSGIVTVTVTAANINSDGVPGNATLLDQDFALVGYNFTQVFTPTLVATGAAMVAESCSPTNGAVDPGETVTLNLGVRNTGNGNTINLVATLLSTNGVTSPSAPQTYGALTAGGSAMSQPFTFTANGPCGGSITASLQLQDGSTNYGNVTYTFSLGQKVARLAENFDNVTAPVLPVGWTTSSSGTQSNWITSTTAVDTVPNAAFSADSSSIGLNELDTPPISVTSGAAVLSFRQNYSLSANATNSADGYDGGVLEIKIGAGSYNDIIASGGSFGAGSYGATLTSANGNPLAGRQAWSGNSGGFVPTIVNLPAAAAGQNFQLRWRCGTGTNPPPVSSSGTLAYWSFEGPSAAPTTTMPNLSASSVTVSNVGGSLTFFGGNGGGSAVASSGFSTSSGPPTTSFSAFAFSITVSNGFQAALTSVSLDTERSGSGPPNFSVQASSQANFSSLIYDSGVKTAGTSFVTTTLTLANSGLTGTIYFRVYAYKATGSGGTFRIDNLRVQGTTTGGSTGGAGWFIDSISVTDPVCCSATTNQPPVINAANINPAAPSTTNELVAAVTSATDPDANPIIFAYQWQGSANNATFNDLGGQTASNLAAAITVAGDYYRVVITPNDGATNGAPFTTVSVAIPVDADGNGINDDWEMQYFGHIGIDPNADPDGDGSSNLQEFLAGTDPTDSGSALRITSIVTNGPDVIVSFTTCSNKAYDAQHNDDLTTSNWSGFATNIPGTGAIVSTNDPGAASLTNRFYRIRLVP